MALSAGLSILMTVFVFPYLHHRLPENLFLRLCSYPHVISKCADVQVYSHILLELFSSHSLGISITYLTFRYQRAFVYFCRFKWSFAEWVTFQLRQSLILTLTERCQLTTSLLDTIVLDKIPNPEYLALANSLTFSIAVSHCL
jgi:hypothetical protein